MKVLTDDQSSFILTRLSYVEIGVEPVARPKTDFGHDLIYLANISATTLSGSLQRITLIPLMILDSIEIKNEVKR